MKLSLHPDENGVVIDIKHISCVCILKEFVKDYHLVPVRGGLWVKVVCDVLPYYEKGNIVDRGICL